MTSSSDHRAAILAAPYRRVRVLDADEGPFAGTLVAVGDAIAVCADAALLSGWAGWAFAGSEHVAGPIDLVRRADGHDVLLPWCTERVAVFLGRRLAAREPLSAGECSTLIVSLLRALTDLGSAAHAEEPTGTWWLVEDGRPVFVIGPGERARTGALALLEQMGDDRGERAVGRLLAAIRGGLHKSVEEQPAAPRLLLERWEAEMLEIAAPRALRRERTPVPDGTPSVRHRDAHGASATLPLRASRRAREGARGRRRREVIRGRLFGNSLAATAARLVARMPGRVRPDGTHSGAFPRREGRARRGDGAPAGRARMLALGAAVAAVVIAGGLMLPDAEATRSRANTPSDTGADGVGGREPSTTAPSAAPPSAGSGSSETGLPETASDEDPGRGATQPVGAMDALWPRLTRCAEQGDVVCDGSVAEGSTGVIEAIVAVTDAGEPGFALIDAYGDIAVVRASFGEGTAPGAGAERVVVLVCVDEKWLARYVYDVAGQPE